MNKFPALLVGHCCHDTLFLANGSKFSALGGSVSYISTMFADLDIDYRIVSKVGSDFSYFPQLSQKPKTVAQHPTTHFIADFTQGERIGRVDAICEPIYPEDIPGGATYEVGLAVGIVGEILPATLERLAQRSRYVLCDAQGLIRFFDADGKVGLRPLKDTPFLNLLDKITFLKASRQEAEFIDLEYARKKTCVLMTEGAKGCTVYLRDREFHVPAFVVEETDSTGAGDCFLAGVTVGLLRGLPLEMSILLGNYLGSLAVQQVGIPKLNSVQLKQWFESAAKTAMREVSAVAQ